MLFLQELAKKKAEIYAQYGVYEKGNRDKLGEFRGKQEDKIKELERKRDHAEYMIHMYEDRLKKLRTTRKMATIGSTNT